MTLEKKKLIIFDCDGTVVDSTKHHAQAWLDAFNQLGYPHFEVQQIINDTAALTCEDGYALMCEKYNLDLQHFTYLEFKALLDNKYLEQINRQTEETLCVEGSHDFIETASTRILAIASNGDKTHVEAALTKAKLYDRFKHVVVASDVNNVGKPKPDMLQEILNRTKMRPDETAMFGDTMADASAAKALGIDFYGILGVHYGSPESKAALKQRMYDAGAVHVFENFTEAKQALLTPGGRINPGVTHERYNIS